MEINREEIEQCLVAYQLKFEGWGNRVGLYESGSGASLLTQSLKFYEEYGELCGGELKNKKDVIEDSIGDCFVVLTHLRRFLNGKPFKYNGVLVEVVLPRKTKREIISQIPNLMVEKSYNNIANILVYLSKLETGSAFDCMETAWQEIKDRKGKMINGSFIKESDLK